MTIETNVLRLYKAGGGSVRCSVRMREPGEQLCLFDGLDDARCEGRAATAISVPMQEVHGSTFAALLAATRAAAIVDLRKFPSFALTASTGPATRERMRQCGASYINLPLDLNRVHTKAAEWEVVSRVRVIVEHLRTTLGPIRNECIFLLNRKDDRPIFERSLVAAGDALGSPWRITELEDAAGTR